MCFQALLFVFIKYHITGRYTVATEYTKHYFQNQTTLFYHAAAGTKSFMSLLVGFLIDVLVHKKGFRHSCCLPNKLEVTSLNGLACMYMLFYMHHASDASRMSLSV